MSDSEEWSAVSNVANFVEQKISYRKVNDLFGALMRFLISEYTQYFMCYTTNSD